MEMSEQVIGKPCKYMIYSEDGYHGCAISTTLLYDKHPDKKIETPFGTIKLNHPVLCAWFYDIDGGRTTEDDVPKICPLKYTYKQIDSRIYLLNQKFFRSKKYREEQKAFREWLKQHEVEV